MTTPTAGPRSLRFSPDELLQGMLASIEDAGFSDDAGRLATMFGDLATRFDLFAPMGAAATPGALDSALAKREARKVISRADGRYAISVAGRAQCVSCKRTLFNPQDRGQLEAAAKAFAAL